MAATDSASKTSKPQSGKVLIVDSESLMCELLQFRFENEGFKALVCDTADKALELDLREFSLILVDLMEQKFNGLKFTQAVKQNPDTVSIPIIIMSAKASEDNIVDGLEAGADDFIAKPFSTRELIARVRSIIRRRSMLDARRLANVVTYRGLTLDMGAGTATADGTPLALSHIEFKLLAMFLRHRNRFFDRTQILSEVWGNDDPTSNDRTVDTNISRLRKKLGDYSRSLINRKGFGYGFVE